MPEPVVEIPNRPAFRASEVCEIAGIPTYVLRSWEKEFPNLGVIAKPGGPRVYRRADVEQVVRIRHLLFAEGLTLAGARRKLEGEPKPEDEPLPDLSIPGDVREKVARIKHELRGLLDLLSEPRVVPRPGDENAAAATTGGRGEDDAPRAGRIEEARAARADEDAGPVPRPESEVSLDLPLLDVVEERPPERPRARRSARRKP